MDYRRNGQVLGHREGDYNARGVRLPRGRGDMASDDIQGQYELLVSRAANFSTFHGGSFYADDKGKSGMEMVSLFSFKNVCKYINLRLIGFRRLF